jgi:hypothetical protein
MRLSECQAGTFEQRLEYRCFMPTRINTGWILDDPKLLDLLG